VCVIETLHNIHVSITNHDYFNYLEDACDTFTQISYEQEGRSVSVCQISSKSLELRLRYGDFSIF